MYRYIEGKAATRTEPGYYQLQPLDTMTFIDIFATYADAYAVLEVVELQISYSLDLYDLPTTVRSLPITFGDWLVSVGNATLPTTPIVPDKTPLYATYREVWNAGFQVKAYNRWLSEDTPLTQDQMIDALVSKSGVDYEALDNHALFLVNGLVCNSAATERGIIVRCAGTSLRKCNDNRMGILNFEKLGAVARYPITNERLVPPGEFLPYNEGVYLRLTDIDIADKTIGLVIGGYLHLLDGQYSRVGTHLLKLRMDDYPLVERYWALNHYGDSTGIDVTRWENRPDRIDLTELTSDANIAGLLTNEQSFIFTIDNPDVTVSRMQVHQAELGGRLYAYDRPQQPIIDNAGRLVNYTWYHGRHHYVLRTSLYFYYHYVRRTTDFMSQTVATDHKRTTNPRIYNAFYWLRIAVPTDTTSGYSAR